jgi:fatty acid/phospholipid biosynthesis enzyme
MDVAVVVHIYITSLRSTVTIRLQLLQIGEQERKGPDFMQLLHESLRDAVDWKEETARQCCDFFYVD